MVFRAERNALDKVLHSLSPKLLEKYLTRFDVAVRNVRSLGVYVTEFYCPNTTRYAVNPALVPDQLQGYAILSNDTPQELIEETMNRMKANRVYSEIVK